MNGTMDISSVSCASMASSASLSPDKPAQADSSLVGRLQHAFRLVAAETLQQVGLHLLTAQQPRQGALCQGKTLEPDLAWQTRCAL